MKTVNALIEATMWSDLATFLDAQCKERGLSWREASLKAGLDHAAISRFIRGTTPSPESCRKLAVFFGVPEDIVLSLAGHKSELPDEDEIKSQAIRAIEYLMRQLPENRQREILEMVRTMHRLYTEQQDVEEEPE
jgi:transcriptional regulator with XRE-family HTH domain